MNDLRAMISLLMLSERFYHSWKDRPGKNSNIYISTPRPSDRAKGCVELSRETLQRSASNYIMAKNTLLTLEKKCKHKNQEQKMSTHKHITDHYNKKIRRLNEYIKISKTITGATHERQQWCNKMAIKMQNGY